MPIKDLVTSLLGDTKIRLQIIKGSTRQSADPLRLSLLLIKHLDPTVASIFASDKISTYTGTLDIDIPFLFSFLYIVFY